MQNISQKMEAKTTDSSQNPIDGRFWPNGAGTKSLLSTRILTTLERFVLVRSHIYGNPIIEIDKEITL